MGEQVAATAPAVQSTPEVITHPGSNPTGEQPAAENKGGEAEVGSSKAMFFSDETSMSEAELSGETSDESLQPVDAGSADPKDENADKEADVPTDEKGGDKTKPPHGFVPQEALHATRQSEKKAKARADAAENENHELRKQIIALREGKGADVPGRFQDFKVLSDQEYLELLSEDADAAALYLKKNVEYNEYVRDLNNQKERLAFQKAQKAKEHKNMVSSTFDAIRTEVPGIYDKDSGVMDDLADFAIQNGFDPQALKTLTHPGTIVMSPDSDAPMPLGDCAKGLVVMLHNIKKNMGTVNESSIREQVRRDETARLTKELMAKIKNGSTDFISLDEIPNAGNAPKETVTAYTEEQWEKLPAAEREKLLAGA